jgi:hypothetical protein
MVKPANAQTIPKPPIPKFTLQREYNYVDMMIKFQPIIPNGHDSAGIFIHIRIKNHDSKNWADLTAVIPHQGIGGMILGYLEEIQLGRGDEFGMVFDFKTINALLGLSNDFHQIDFQVEAVNGYLNATPTLVHSMGLDFNASTVIVVNTSGWSDTQTIAIPAYSSTSSSNPTASQNPSPTLTPTPKIPEFPMWIIPILLIIMVVAGLLVYFKKHR